MKIFSKFSKYQILQEESKMYTFRLPAQQIEDGDVDFNNIGESDLELWSKSWIKHEELQDYNSGSRN